ncbi:MAG: GNAT family N-acetyltransferase [Anaerolineae bacterium]|nr:GNAT family N-acetyltransferase [Anaerolineae bacterium]
MNADVRPMTRDDVPVIVRWMVEIPLWQRYGLTVEKATSQFERAFERHDVLLAADHAGWSACGFAWCLPEGAFGRSMYLRLIGVHPEKAGSGVGGVLLTQAEREAAKTGRDLFLLVSDFNADAQRFYRHHGYEQIGAIPGYVLPDTAELIFRKRL